MQTRWIFLEVETRAGNFGVGEASLLGQEEAVAQAVARFAPAIFTYGGDPALEAQVLERCRSRHWTITAEGKHHNRQREEKWIA